MNTIRGKPWTSDLFSVPSILGEVGFLFEKDIDKHLSGYFDKPQEISL